MSAGMIKILLVEDSASDAELLRESLHEAGPGQFEFTQVETLGKALAQLGGGQFDVVLLDLSLPDSTGRETFKRAHEAAPEIPIVLLTGAEGETIGLEAVREGIQDYLRKGQADGVQTARAIRYAIERHRARAELRRAGAELELRVAERTADLKKSVEVLREEIARRRQNEWHVEGVRGMLELFATKSTRQAYVDSAVRLLRDWSGCRCAGIRLVNGDGQMPYAACVGYSRPFLKLENCLSLDTADCPCSRIFRGRSLVSDTQFRSRKGSFFCNHADQLAEAFCRDAAKRSELACLQAGYNSLAHAPIRYQEELLGTIHLADRRPERFPAQTISFIESVAPLIGEALHRFAVEESLLESERRFRSMFEDHDAPMLLVDPEPGTIEDANPAAAALYGYSREQLCQMKIEDLCAVPPQTAESLRQRARNQSRGYATFLHRLAGGEVRTVEIHSSMVGVRGRRLVFAIIHDVTERKLLQKQILDIGESERQRIGRDLHDSLGGMLTGAALLTKALAHRLAVKGIEESAVAEETVRCINDSIGQTRAIARGLFPAELSAVGLVAGLQEFAAETAKRSGVRCQLRADKGIVIGDKSVASHLFRIVQEAVSNAVRHGRARHVTIRLARVGDRVSLEVRDDGRGLPPQELPAKGLGLQTMRYRADVIGAQFVVSPGEQGGTVVSCLLPLRTALGQPSG